MEAEMSSEIQEMERKLKKSLSDDKQQSPSSNMSDWCETHRIQIKVTGDKIKALMDHEIFKGEQEFPGQHGEMKANIMLSYRHLEDARMRLGKVMQQLQGGVSKYDQLDNKG